MSIITDEMDRLKQISLGKFDEIAKDKMEYINSKQIFELGYAYGMDDARRIQEIIKTLAQEAV